MDDGRYQGVVTKEPPTVRKGAGLGENFGVRIRQGSESVLFEKKFERLLGCITILLEMFSKKNFQLFYTI